MCLDIKLGNLNFHQKIATYVLRCILILESGKHTVFIKKISKQIGK
jgi:hypothetical protein